MIRFYFTAMFVVCLAAHGFAGQEYTGHYSGPMDVESHSVTRVNDGDEGEMLTLEELDQATIHNVVRQATRPEAVEMVRQLTKQQGGQYVLTPEEQAAAAVEKARREAEAAKLDAERAAEKAEAERLSREAQMAVSGIRPKAPAKPARPTEAVRVAGEVPQQPPAEKVEGTAEIVEGGMVGLQQSLDALHRNPKLIRGHGPQVPPQR